MSGGQFVLRELARIDASAEAAQRAAERFPDYPDLERSLMTWVESDEAQEVVLGLFSATTRSTDHDLVASFISGTGFYTAHDIEVIAQEILAAFLQELEQALLNSPEGPGLHDQKQTQLHLETQNLVAEVGTGLSNQVAQLSAQFASLTARPLSALPLGDPGAPAREQAFHAEIDTAKGLIELGQFVSAQSVLMGTRGKAQGEQVSQRVLFRIATNLGACAHALDNRVAAREEFQAALRIEPENPDALANVAITLVDDDAEEALRLSREALSRNPRQVHAMCIQIECLFRAGEDAATEALVAEAAWVQESVTGCLMLGRLFVNRGEFERAEALLRTAQSLDPDSAGPYLSLSIAIILPLQRALTENLDLPYRLPRERLAEAEALLTRAIEILGSHQLSRVLTGALTDRAELRRMDGRLEQALGDCERVLMLDPEHLGARVNKALTLLELDRAREAIPLLETTRGTLPNGELSLALAYLEAERPEDAQGMIEPIWASSDTSRLRLRAGDILLRAAQQLSQPTRISEIVTEIEMKWPNDAEALAILGEAKRRAGDLTAAERILRSALTVGVGAILDQVNIELADILYSQERYIEAIPLYDSALNAAAPLPLRRRLLISLFRARRWREALNLAQDLKGAGPAIPTVTEIESIILEQTGDLESARNLRLALIQVEPRSVSHQVRAAFLALRMGDEARAREEIIEIRWEDLQGHANSLTATAEVYALLGISGALELAYRGLAAGFGDADQHLAYCRIFLALSASNPPYLRPTEVSPDSVVVVD